MCHFFLITMANEITDFLFKFFISPAVEPQKSGCSLCLQKEPWAANNATCPLGHKHSSHAHNTKSPHLRARAEGGNQLSSMFKKENKCSETEYKQKGSNSFSGSPMDLGKRGVFTEVPL